MTTLKSCPFCGYNYVIPHTEDGKHFFVWCPQCNAGGPRNFYGPWAESEREAIEVWNKRDGDKA